MSSRFSADGLQADVRYAIRVLRLAPGFTIVAVLTLAIGIGATTAIFTVVNSLLLRTLPVAEPHRLATLGAGTTMAYPWTYAIWQEIERRARRAGADAMFSPSSPHPALSQRERGPGFDGAMFDGAVAWAGARLNLAQGGEIDPVDGLFASGDFFRTLGVTARLGRTLTAADDDAGGGAEGPVAVISHGLWQRRFGGAANVIGRPIAIDRVPFTIVGVTPPEFFGPEVGRSFDVALPLAAEALIRGKDSALGVRHAYWLTIMVRLAPTQSIEAATAALRALQPSIRDAAMPDAGRPRARDEFLNEPFTLAPAAAGTSPLRQRYERPLLIMLVVVALVLLIACANVANLLLARAAARRHDLSVRLALGASRAHLARALLVESLLLAALGAIAGSLLAAWGSRALVAQLSTATTRVALDLTVDWRVAGFTAAVTLLTVVIFGVAPAFRATRVAPADALEAQGRGTVSSGGSRAAVSSSLVIVQIALSLMLVVAAGLFIGTFARLARVPLGFDSARVLLINVDATRARIDAAERVPFYHRLVEAVAAVPGVAHAGASMVTPVSGSMWNFPVDVPGAPPMADRDRFVRGNAITPGWLATYGTAIVAGRDIDSRDTSAAPPIALVNEAFARRFFPGRQAVGGLITPLAPPGSTDPRVPETIAGVVRDAVYRSLRDAPQPTVYRPLAQRAAGRPPATFSLSVQAAAGSPVSLARSVTAALAAVDRDLAFSLRPLSDQVQASFAQERLLARLSGLFGVVALLLAGLGLYGVTSYAAARRRAEIGLRMALGARRADVIRLVLRRSLTLTAIGIALGLASAAAVTRVLQGLLFGLTPLDPPTFLGVALLFAAVAAIAAFVPARRATMVDPLIALRRE